MSTELTTAKPGELAQAHPSAIEGMMRDPIMRETVMRDPALLREYLAIAERIEATNAKREYVTAFLAAKSDLDGLKITKRGAIVYPAKAGSGKKDSVVKFMRYDDIAEIVKPTLQKHDLVASYSYELLSGAPKVVCVMTLMHKSGHSQEFRSVPLPMLDQSGGKNDIQAAGSVGTYGRRYVVCPAFDIVAEGEDDDGSMKAVPDLITEDQAIKIDEIVQSVSDKDPKFRQRFMARLKTEMSCERIDDLHQGEQLSTIMGWLKR